MSKSRFVLKQAKVGGGGASDLTRYVAKSKLDPEREGRGARPLFTDRADDLSFWEARKWLSITGGALSRDDVLHYILSFEHPQEYLALGENDDERTAEVRTYLRGALSQAARETGIENWRWAAGVHLNEPNPHVHILLSKNAIESKTGDLMRVSKLLPPLVAHYQRQPGERRFDYGVIINSFASGVDAKLSDRTHERARTENKKRELGWMRARPSVWSDRLSLGKSMVARYEVERLERDLTGLETHGDKRRLRVFDETHGRVRHISEFDVRVRAEAEARRATNAKHITSVATREATRHQVFESNLTAHDKTLAEHAAKRQGHKARLEKRLDKASAHHESLQPRVAEIRERYREAGTPLPVPLLAPEQVSKLQDAAVEARDPARIRVLEKIREHLAVERGEPARDAHERGRLRAQLREAETDLHARTWRERQFDRNHHLTRWEIEGGRWSLAGVDLAIEKERIKTRFVHVGVAAWIPSWKKDALEETERLQEIRRRVEEHIDARRAELTAERERASETIKTLAEICDCEPQTRDRGERSDAIEMPRPIYTRAELTRMFAHAETVLNGDLLLEMHEAEKEMRARLAPDKRRPIEEMAAHAVGRAVVAELDFGEAQKARAEHARWGRFTPVAARLADGSTVTGSVRQTEVRSRADLIIHIAEDSPERRERHEGVRRAAAAKTVDTETTFKAAGEYLAAACRLADGYREELARAGKPMPEPLFSPKELNRIDLYRARASNAEERLRFQQLLDHSELHAPQYAGREQEFSPARDHPLARQHEGVQQPEGKTHDDREPHVYIR